MADGKIVDLGVPRSSRGGCTIDIKGLGERQLGRPSLKHDPEKWLPVFGKDHAQAKR
jgi:hypothetical protein